MTLDDLPSIPLASLPTGDIVYFVRCFGLVKIGQTKDAPKRLRVLQTQNAAPLDVVAWGFGTVARERSLHRQFMQHRHHGEWFAPHAEIFITMRDAAENNARWRRIEADEDARLLRELEDMKAQLRDKKMDLWMDNASRGILD